MRLRFREDWRALFWAFVLFPLVVFAIALWPVLGTSYIGLPIEVARLVTLVGFALCVFLFERTLVTGFQFLTTRKIANHDYEFTPAMGRRAFVLGAIGLAAVGGGVALARKLYRAAAFSYDGTQYKGPIVQPITPNDLFYCVTKNVIDPKVNIDLWHLEIGGLVQNSATWRFQDLTGFKPATQETTLMCISNGLDAGFVDRSVAAKHSRMVRHVALPVWHLYILSMGLGGHCRSAV